MRYEDWLETKLTEAKEDDKFVQEKENAEMY